MQHNAIGICRYIEAISRGFSELTSVTLEVGGTFGHLHRVLVTQCVTQCEQADSLFAGVNANHAGIGISEKGRRAFTGTVGGMGCPTYVANGEADGPARRYHQGTRVIRKGAGSLTIPHREEAYSAKVDY